ncbi:DUF6215 domain-containing protein [Streptomyces sp. NPDC004667]|uniref:DUF6215 domain-containing protein n=1 Tax=Streptomyces sp. NPDC004667 TaxID=3154285 RepID=UPI0033BD5DEE
MGGTAAGPGRGMNAAAQAVAAVVLVGGLGGAAWVLGESGGQPADRGPAACSHSGEDLPAEYVSGARLCEALNRPDLPVLLGTPGERAETASGSGDRTARAGGDRTASSQATVTLKSHSVKVTASYDRLPVAGMAGLLGDTAREQTVLGRPAVLYSDHTIALRINLGGAGGGSGGPGGIARHLLVARDAKDGGGSYELVIWRQDDMVPDEAALLRVAEQVLPTIPGWASG